MSSELSANEVIKIVQELKALERRFGGEEGVIKYLLQISENLNYQHQVIDNSNNKLENLFQKLQDVKNLKIEVEKLRFEVVSKKEFDELQQLFVHIKGFKILISQKTKEINDAYLKLNKLWFEEDEVLQRIEKLEKNLSSKVLFGGIGIGIFLTITVIFIATYFL